MALSYNAVKHSEEQKMDENFLRFYDRRKNETISWILNTCYNSIKYDVGVKSFWPLWYRIALHCALPQFSKTFVIRSFFFEKWLLTHVFGGSQGQKFSCKQACVELLTFWPWYHQIKVCVWDMNWKVFEQKQMWNLDYKMEQK